jgi:hypothetical protein
MNKPEGAPASNENQYAKTTKDMLRDIIGVHFDQLRLFTGQKLCKNSKCLI